MTRALQGKRLQLYSALSAGLAAVSLSLAFASGSRTELSLKEVCAIDHEYCDRLRAQPDGSIIQPRPEILKILKEISSDIHEIAKIYQVDPVVIAANILAENTMNVNVVDKVQNWLVANSIAPSGKVLGRSFSVGLGQIKPESAEDVEPMVARIEKREIQSFNEVSKRLLTPHGSVTYNAAILKTAIDAYQKIGVDIRQRPAIQATLYNLGNVRRRSDRLAILREQAKKSNQPIPDAKPNYFGFFVAHYYDLVAQTIGTAEGAKSQAQTREISQSIDTPVSLTKSVPICDPGKGFSAQNSAPAAGVGTYQILTREVNCDMTPFSFVVFDNGALGWIPSEQLDRLSIPVAKPIRKCQTPNAARCMNDLDMLTRKNSSGILTSSDVESGIISIPLRAVAYGYGVSKDLSPAITFKPNSISNSFFKYLEAEGAALKRHLEIKAGLGSWEDSKNPYRPSLQWLEQLNACQPSCVSEGISPEDLLSWTTSARRSIHSDGELKQALERLSKVRVRSVESDSEVREAMAPYFESCEPLTKISSNSNNHLSDLKNFVKIHSELSGVANRIAVKQPLGKIKSWKMITHMIEETAQACRAYQTCESKTIPDPISGTNCRLSQDFKNIESFCEFAQGGMLRKAIQNAYKLQCYFLTGAGSESGRLPCEHDFETASDFVSNLADISCVDKIIVPDRNVKSMLDESRPSSSQKIFYGDMLTRELMVFLKQECTAGGK